MISVIQRVTEAAVRVDNDLIAEINQGLVALVAVEKNDDQKHTQRLAERLINYRIFADDQGRMNLSVRDIQGGILLVPQFTLAADTQRGMRPSFTPAAEPDQGKRLFDSLVKQVRNQHRIVQCGMFGADMQISLVNDGPVTFILRATTTV